MRQQDFPPNDRGRSATVVGTDYVSYCPEKLPRQIDYDNELVRVLTTATAALHRLAGVGRLLPNPTLLIAPYVRMEAVLSSRIEGTQSDVEDLLKLEAGDDESVGGLAEDAQEVLNYVRALNYGISRLGAGFPMSLRLLREVHERLMTGVRGSFATPGEFRRSQNWIGGTSPANAAFVPPPVSVMHPALDDLEDFLHSDSLPLLLQLALAHYQFEVIHPFLDGNGRLGRLLIPLMLNLRGALPQPLLYLSAYFQENRNQYYDLLMGTSRTGDIQPWILFFLRGVIKQATDAEERTVRLVELQTRTRNELLNENAGISVIRTAELLFSAPYLSANTLARELEVSAPTARAAIETLVARGDLVEATGRRRNRFYRAPAIYEAVYGQLAKDEIVTDSADNPGLF